MLDDGSLKGNALKAERMEGVVPRCGGKVPVIVPAAVALMGLIALIVSRVGQLLGLLLQQLVQRIFHASLD